MIGNFVLDIAIQVGTCMIFEQDEALECAKRVNYISAAASGLMSGMGGGSIFKGLNKAKQAKKPRYTDPRKKGKSMQHRREIRKKNKSSQKAYDKKIDESVDMQTRAGLSIAVPAMIGWMTDPPDPRPEILMSEVTQVAVDITVQELTDYSGNKFQVVLSAVARTIK